MLDEKLKVLREV